MGTFGHLCLLAALVASGYAAFATLVSQEGGGGRLLKSGHWAAGLSLATLTTVVGVLGWALVRGDFRFSYAAQYSSQLLPWYYAISALWAGQAGSLLLWAWFMAILAVAYRFVPRRRASDLREPAFGILMASLCFLVMVMVFGADPMEQGVADPGGGRGLSPLLQHPVMLIHPPIVFFAYAGWAIPFALAFAALLTGRLDSSWTREARPWALLTWVVLGIGILLGAEWAYEELGWGGYWAWDPVENGSLIPWLTGTALLHGLMAWRHREALKRTTLALAITTFALCNFASFLTRSGIFSSVHAFSRSPIGWLFLVLMAGPAVGGGLLMAARRQEVQSRPIASLWTRESMVLMSTVALLLLAGAAIAGSLAAPLSKLVTGRAVTVGMAFYNNVFIPTGLVLLGTTALAPLTRWGAPPSVSQRKAIYAAAGGGGLGVAAALVVGVRHPVALAVVFLAVAAAAALTGAAVLDIRGKDTSAGRKPLAALASNRRRYAGFLVHMGIVCLAIGICGSSLGSREHEVRMGEGQTIHWAGHSIRLARLVERELPDKLIVEAHLEVSRGQAPPALLIPAQHFHRLQETWTTEVAIRSDGGRDFYVILHGSAGEDAVALTLIVNPMMRWLWASGWMIAAAAILGLWPKRGSSKEEPSKRRSEQKASVGAANSSVRRARRRTVTRSS
jgi:cytochrome c-type biogenesis protein CcmF